MANKTQEGEKIILIGSGDVGASYAFALVAQGIGRELGIIDVNVDKSEGDALDLADGLAFTPPKKIYAADYEDCWDASLIVLTAGAAQEKEETRLDLIKKNFKIAKMIVDKVMKSGFDGIFLVASNPVDIITYAVWKFSGLPTKRVIGSGTSLDSARFRGALADLIEVDPRDIHAYIIGEHGDSQFPVWSHANVGGLQIQEWMNTHPEVTEEVLKKVETEVRDAAYTIIQKKGSTYYGIAIALARITKAIFENQNAILPLSVYLDGLYGEKDIYIGMPAVINRSGVNCVIEIPLNELESQKMKASATTIRLMQEEAFRMLS